MKRSDLRAALQNRNVRAFLRVIRNSESSQDDTAYFLENGGRKLSTWPVEHPSKGMRSPPGKAFGAYQFIASTWAGLVRQYGFEDMSPQSQDEAAVALIAGRGALDEVVAGDLDAAFLLLEKEWTSLPGGAEENSLTKEAKQVFLQWGGTLKGGAAHDTLSTEHYGEEVTESVIRPVPSADQQETHMAPILAAVLPTLISAAPDLIRLFGKGEQSKQNAVIAERVAGVAVKVTNAVNEQEAAQKIASDPLYAKAFRMEVSENFDQWMGMMTKFHEMDETSRAKAREFSLQFQGAGMFWFNPVFWISLVLLLLVYLLAVDVFFVHPESYTGELRVQIVTGFLGILLVVGGFWLGSSQGSQAKDQRVRGTDTSQKE